MGSLISSFMIALVAAFIVYGCLVFLKDSEDRTKRICEKARVMDGGKGYEREASIYLSFLTLYILLGFCVCSLVLMASAIFVIIFF